MNNTLALFKVFNAKITKFALANGVISGDNVGRLPFIRSEYEILEDGSVKVKLVYRNRGGMDSYQFAVISQEQAVEFLADCFRETI